MTFKKGWQGGPGRPEGSKNKNYLNASLWLEVAWNDMQSQTPEERWPKVKWAVEQILGKVAMLPVTPGDSVSNAIKTAELMNGLAPGDTPLESKASPLETPPTNGNEGQNGHG